jgi:hypothetical protein
MPTSQPAVDVEVEDSAATEDTVVGNIHGAEAAVLAIAQGDTAILYIHCHCLPLAAIPRYLQSNLAGIYKRTIKY